MLFTLQNNSFFALHFLQTFTCIYEQVTTILFPHDEPKKLPASLFATQCCTMWQPIVLKDITWSGYHIEYSHTLWQGLACVADLLRCPKQQVAHSRAPRYLLWGLDARPPIRHSTPPVHTVHQPPWSVTIAMCPIAIDCLGFLRRPNVHEEIDLTFFDDDVLTNVQQTRPMTCNGERRKL